MTDTARQALAECAQWLEAALRCKDWKWDGDQREYAEGALAAARSALSEEAVPSGEREAFESWAHASGFNIDRDETEKYKNYHRATTRFARDGWLSALAWVKNSAPSAPSGAAEKEALTFGQAWAEFEKAGYCYGDDALEQVRFGWEIAHGKRPRGESSAPPTAAEVKEALSGERLLATFERAWAGPISDAEVIKRAEAAGFKWLPPDDDEDGFPGGFDMCSLAEIRALLAPTAAAAGVPGKPGDTFKLGDKVRKKSGSQWRGVVVGAYSTTLTPEGYAVESSSERGSVQIYPAAALERDE